jgi:hypothetical protein
MQPKESFDQSASPVMSIVNHGKLSRSSYYDLPVNTNGYESNQMNSNNQEHMNEQQEHAMQVQQSNENLEVWSCMFSPDNSYLAWSCGHGIIKIMRWSKSCYCKKPSHRHETIDPSTAVDYKVFNNSQQARISTGCSDESSGLYTFSSSSSRTFETSNKQQVCYSSHNIDKIIS